MMSDQALSFFSEFHQSAAFRAAFKELIAEEVRYRTETMRNLLRDNQIHRAAAIEGGITALEELPSAIAKYAAQYKPNRI